MKLITLMTLFLILPGPAIAEDDCGDVKGLETKAYADIEQFLKHMRRSDEDCGVVYKKFDEKYLELSHHMYRQYRDYLNRFLTNYTKDFASVKEFQKLSERLKEGKGEELIASFLAKNDTTSKEALLTHFAARYKETNLPVVNQNCDIKLKKKESKQKVMDKINAKLLGEGVKLSTENVCLAAQKDAGYPSEQSSLKFHVDGGKIEMWYCHQSFDSTKEKLYSTKANCFAYDLKNKKSLLGDQRQNHLHGHDRPFEIADARMILARSRGYVPLTYTEFLRKNQDFLPVEPRMFYAKLPKECTLDQKRQSEWIEKARLSLINAEKLPADIQE